MIAVKGEMNWFCFALGKRSFGRLELPLETKEVDAPSSNNCAVRALESELHRQESEAAAVASGVVPGMPVRRNLTC